MPADAIIPFDKFTWTPSSGTLSCEVSDLRSYNPFVDGAGAQVFAVENSETGGIMTFRWTEDVKDAEGELLYERWTSTSRIKDKLLYLKIFND